MTRAAERQLVAAARRALRFVESVTGKDFDACELLCGSSEPLRIVRKLKAAIRGAQRVGKAGAR